MDIAATMVEPHVWLVGELIDRAEQHERMLEELVRTALYLLVTDLERWVGTVDGADPAATDPIAAPADLRKRHTVAGARR